MVLIALANNLDIISVRIAYSIRGIRIPIVKNLWISGITFCISCLAALAGGGLSGVFNKRITSVISMVILTVIGVLIIREQYGKKDDDKGKHQEKGILNILRKPEIADMDNSKEIDFKEATLLGIALSLDNIGGGFTVGMMGFNVFFMGIISAVISFLSLWTGNYISDFLNKVGLGKKAAVFSGIVIIAIGIKQIL
jgi:putative sporulation protein YtaF